MAGMDTFQISLHWAANINESYGCQENCYFFASVVAEHLCSLNEACEISGGLRWLDLGGTVQDTICQRIYESYPTLCIPHFCKDNVEVLTLVSEIESLVVALCDELFITTFRHLAQIIEAQYVCAQLSGAFSEPHISIYI